MLKRNRVTIADAIQAIGAYEKIPIRFVNIDLKEAIKLADKLKIYAYDAYYVRCALKYKSPLLTLDKGLIHSAKLVNVKIVEVEI